MNEKVSMEKPIMISVVVPLYDEAGSVSMLHKKLVDVLRGCVKDEYEIIFVDDGSADGTFDEARKLSPLRLIRFRENYGQTAAIAAGIEAARGRVIVTIDGDLENDPADIPRLLQKLDEGYDVVSGWRQNRWRDHLFTRRIPSIAANKLISLFTGVKLNDHGCALKAYRRNFVSNLYLFGDMHRMLAAYAVSRGGRNIAEIPVSFSPRRFGKSKYGLSRTFKILLDVFAFYFFKKYKNRPMHFFGWFGFWSLSAGFLVFVWMLVLKWFEGKSFIATPLPVLAVFFVIVGLQFILMGLLAEILIRTQHEVGNRPSYNIDTILEL